MASVEQNSGKLVSRETMLLVGLACLVIGFLGGIVFSVYKSPAVSTAPVASQQQAPAENGLSPEQSQRLLSLEMEVIANPNNAEAWTHLGHLYFDSNQFKKAINAYNKSLGLNPGDADVLTDLGVMYRRDGRPQKAIESFNKALKANSSHETAYFNKGIVYLYDLKDKAAALKSWQDLVKINPIATAPNGQLVKEIIDELKAEK